MYISTITHYYDNYPDNITKEHDLCIICWMPSDINNKIYTLKEIQTLVCLCNCNPQLHFDCISKWVDKTNSCPICRKKIEIKKTLLYQFHNYKSEDTHHCCIWFISNAFVLFKLFLILTCFNLFVYSFIFISFNLNVL